MLGLEGMGDVDAADREASFRLPAQRPADLPNGTEMRPAQVLVGAEPLPRPGEIEPGEDERGERKHPGQDRPADEVALEFFERRSRDAGVDPPVGRGQLFAPLRSDERRWGKEWGSS